MDDYLRGITDLQNLAKGVIVGVVFGKKKLQRIATEELLAESITLGASKQYIYGVLDAALTLKIITKKEWQKEMGSAK